MRNRRELAREAKKTRLQFEAAIDRFRREYQSLTAVGILIATGVHFGLFAFNPQMSIIAMESGGEEIVVMTLPPEVRIPPPPQSIARPATPRVSAAEVADEVTIAPTTFEANPVENLPPPPAAATIQRKEHTPFYVAREVEPRLLNGPEIRGLLKQKYPAMLCEAGIQGRVIVWVFVDTAGKPADCLIHSSSGYPLLDEVAREVVTHMRFAPALHMDRPVAVWIAQPIQFSVS